MESPLKWHGGKHYLARRLWNVARQAPHKTRVEAYGGSLAFTLSTDPNGFSEVVNDSNGHLMNFWRVLAGSESFYELYRICQATPFSEDSWLQAKETLASHSRPVERAWAFFVFCRQSLAGRMDSFAPLSRERTRRGMNEQASAWLSAIEGLPDVHERLKRVVILHRPAIEVIEKNDSPHTLFYLDPPYLASTRSDTRTFGDYELSEENHKELLHKIASIRGKFILSGYPSDLYNEHAVHNGWMTHSWELPNNASSGKSKPRTQETIWCNFPFTVTE